MTSGASRLARRRRAGTLRRITPHAAELLAFLEDLIEAQEPLYRQVRAAGWLPGLDDRAGSPRFRRSGIPVAELVPALSGFVRALGPRAPAPLREACDEVAARDPAGLGELLAGWIRDQDPDALDSPSARDVLGRAFLQAVSEAFAERLVEPAPPNGRVCPVCGRRPFVSLLRDEEDVRGRRLLVCPECASEWGFPRVQCAGCGSEDRDALITYEAESVDHVRLQACRGCGTYLKTIDLRRDGLADPFADDVATVELDLWAGEQGFTRLQRNLLGM